MMINKDALSHLMPIGSKNTDVAKIINMGINLVTLCAKFHGLVDVLREPEDCNKIIQILREFHQFHKNIR